jgi:hypothetical protein
MGKVKPCKDFENVMKSIEIDIEEFYEKKPIIIFCE